MMNRWLYLAVATVLAGCTTASIDPDVASDASPSISSEEAGTSSEAPATTTSAGTADETTSTAVAPLRPYDDDPTTTSDEVSTSAYISRVAMSGASIELTWSTSDGAVAYHIHRVVLTDDERPDAAAMTAENEIHVADDLGHYVDTTVETGTRYWYGVRALSADGALVAHGWHRADAVTDTEPPSVVGDLQAVVENGEVVVSWKQPDENYELHGYTVLRGVDGAEPESIVQTWDIEQTSFVDDGAPAGSRLTYAIVAFDFHWNESAPAEVEVSLSE